LIRESIDLNLKISIRKHILNSLFTLNIHLPINMDVVNHLALTLQIITPPKNMDILIVDDDIDFLTIIGRIAKGKSKFSVETTSSVDAALKILSKRRFDVVLSDYHMPMKNGGDLFREIRKRGIHTPFFIWSSSDGDDIDINKLNQDIDGIILKKTDIEGIYGELKSAISKCTELETTDETNLSSTQKFNTSSPINHNKKRKQTTPLIKKQS